MSICMVCGGTEGLYHVCFSAPVEPELDQTTEGMYKRAVKNVTGKSGENITKQRTVHVSPAEMMDKAIAKYRREQAGNTNCKDSLQKHQDEYRKKHK